jgi:predicted Zn-dependent protease
LLLSDVPGAKQAIERALALSPGLEFLRYTHAEILRHAADEDGVRAELSAIVRDNPRAVEASVELAAMAMRKNDRDSARDILLSAYNAGARDPDLLDRLGQHMLLAGRQAEAGAFFAQSLVLWPDDPAALLEEGRADLRANDIPRAIERFRRCAAGSDSFECRMELARAYVLGPRDLAAAREALKSARAIAADPRLRDEADQRLAALDAMAR